MLLVLAPTLQVCCLILGRPKRLSPLIREVPTQLGQGRYQTLLRALGSPLHIVITLYIVDLMFDYIVSEIGASTFCKKIELCMKDRFGGGTLS